MVGRVFDGIQVFDVEEPTMPEPTYTIAEIKRYLEGYLFKQWWQDSKTKIPFNHALTNAIKNLDDPQDGLAAVTERNKDELE